VVGDIPAGDGKLVNLFLRCGRCNCCGFFEGLCCSMILCCLNENIPFPVLAQVKVEVEREHYIVSVKFDTAVML